MSLKSWITFTIATFFLTWGLVSGGHVRGTWAQQNPQSIAPSGITYTGGSGKSLKQAIIIKGAKNSTAGIAAEYQYLEKKFGKPNADWNLIGQRLLEKDGKHFDLMKIELADGTKKEIYFDITDFFQKF